MSRALVLLLVAAALAGVGLAVAEHNGLLSWLPGWMLPPSGKERP
jgi:hypothetical protein